jgi:hypothetical protein
MQSFIFVYMILILFSSCPGDPRDEDYYDYTPPMVNATLNFVGAVSYHNRTLPNHRLFGLDLAIYKERIGKEVITQDTRVLCLFDNDNMRWRNYHLPYLNRYIHVSGKTIGFGEIERRKHLCILITNLSFLPSAPSANFSSPAPSTTQSVTPSRRPRTWGNDLQSPTEPQSPTKRRRVGAAARDPSPSVQLLGRLPSPSPAPTETTATDIQTLAEQTLGARDSTKQKRSSRK